MTVTPSYTAIGESIGRLVEEKQAAYGDSFGKSGAVMRLLYPEGIPLTKLDDALTVIRVVDKLFRIATDRDALGESPWRDVAGYAILSVRRVEAQRAELEPLNPHHYGVQPRPMPTGVPSGGMIK